MKKSAHKEVASKAKPKHVQEKEEVVVPPDILGDKTAELAEPENTQENADIQENTPPAANVPEPTPSDERVDSDKPTDTPQVQTDRGPENEPQIEKNNRKLFFFGAFVFILTVLVTSAIGYLVVNTNQPEEEEKILVTEASPTPIADVPEEIDRSEWKFEVLNGSGVSGAAAKASDSLEELGYEVVKVGNSDEVESTELYLEKGKSDEEIDLLIKDLEEDFGGLSVTGELTDSDANVKLVLGE